MRNKHRKKGGCGNSGLSKIMKIIDRAFFLKRRKAVRIKGETPSSGDSWNLRDPAQTTS